VTPQHVPAGKDHVAIKPGIEARQAATALAQAAKPAGAAAPSPGQASNARTASPTPAQTPQAGTGHGGTGSEGHGASAGQQAGPQGAAPAPGAATGASSASASVFSVPNATTGTAAGVKETVKLPDGLVRGAVTLQEAVDAVKATFTAANQAGVSSARISLSPVELGGIKISLSQTADGLIARVATDHPEAAQTLQQNAADLKRSLEASGMQLLRLDIGSSGQQSLGGFMGSQGDSSSTSASSTGEPAQATADQSEPTGAELTIELSSGSLVNVLA
jgi:flagellar hook-length control protein FliK